MTAKFTLRGHNDDGTVMTDVYDVSMENKEGQWHLSKPCACGFMKEYLRPCKHLLRIIFELGNQYPNGIKKTELDKCRQVNSISLWY